MAETINGSEYVQTEIPIPQSWYEGLKAEAAKTIDEMTIAERVQNKRQWLSDISDLELLCRLVDDANSSDCIEVDIV